ncbi:MAG: mechanosensitive ion channel [Verrucomicrobiota bacterium]
MVRLRPLFLALLSLVFLIGNTLRADTPASGGSDAVLDAAPEPGEATEEPQTNTGPEPSTLVWWNREITTFRSTTTSLTPAARSVDALERIDAASAEIRETAISTKKDTIDGEAVVRFQVGETYLFSLLDSDLDKLSGETLEEARKAAIENLEGVRLARIEQGSAQAIAKGVTTALVATVVFIAALFLLRMITRRLANLVEKRIRAMGSLRVSRTDLRPHLGLLGKQLIKVLAFFAAIYLFAHWIAFAFNQFPLTAPLGAAFTQRLKDFGGGLLQTIVAAIPGLVTAALILLVTRWFARLVDRIVRSMGDDSGTGVMANDAAKATRRISVACIWILGVVLAYPYLPGSGSEAFKGISVLLGLMVSLGSSGMINQVMSGFVLLYSGSVRTGEYVKVGQIEGTITEMGILAVKVLTSTKEYLTIPNAVMITNPMTNYSRLKKDTGVPISSVVTIGYDAPWRQVHELLSNAAKETKGVSESPEPRVLQKALSDWYAEYTLTAYINEPEARNAVISELNGHIQDAFNEAGIQIMSPHYRDDPPEPLVIPKERWFPSKVPAPEQS